MTFLRSRSMLAVLSSAFALACASAHPGSEAGARAEPRPGGAVGIARDKLHVAELELALAQKTAEEDRARKAQELDLAQRDLHRFDEVDSPVRLARERLSLTRNRDELAEQEEELAQLEMTYADVDLADKTREIVLQRNHRRVERAKEELAIAERELAKLEKETLPLERAKLAMEVDQKTHALENAERSAEIGLLGKQVAIEEARANVEKAETSQKEAGKGP